MSNATNSSIQTTVESEQKFRKYVRNERERRRNEKVEEELSEFEDKLDTDTEIEIEDEAGSEREIKNSNLTRYNARVTEVDFNKATERLQIKFEDYKGDTYKEMVKAGLPEDIDNPYVRLCKWIGIMPEHPADLHGETIPITRSEDDASIDYPPIPRRLNPVAFRSKRGVRKARSFVESRDRLHAGVKKVGFAFGVSLPGLIFLLSFLTIGWVAHIDRTGVPILTEVFAYLIMIPALIACFMSGFACFELYGRMILKAVVKGIVKTGQGIIWFYRFLFPKADSE